MPTIRRLYFYAVAFVSFELVLWGVIGLLRSIVARPLVPSTDALARALALILVGVPIFLVHWRWTSRAADRDPEERAATVRAVFLYGIQLSTLLPVVQNTLALLDRSLVELAGVRGTSALVGGGQSLTDNLIAIVLNGIAAYYFYRVTRRDWTLLERRESYADVRRLYRFIWVLYSLSLTVLGVQQVIRYLFFIPSGTLGLFSRQIFLNALALLLVGAPLWVYTWQLSLSALDEPGERESNLRLALLYLLSMVSALTVLGSAGALLSDVLLRVFGAIASTGELVGRIGGPLSLLVPFAALWLYYGQAYARAIDDQSDPARRAALRRLYHYPLSLAGLGATFVGTTILLTYIIRALFITFLTPLPLGSQLSSGLAALIVGLPVWLFMWRGLQAEAGAPGDEGGHARRSLVRKVYLFFVIFAAVIGSMSAAVWLVFQVISALLSRPPANFVQQLLIALQLLLLFVAVLLYHLSVLRRDGARTADALTARHADFPVLVLAPDEAFSTAVTVAMSRTVPDMPIIIHAADQPLAVESLDGARAAVLPATFALDPPEAIRLWLDGFEGPKVVVPEDVTGWVWTGQSPRPLEAGARGAALALRQLAEGEAVRPSTPASAWTIVLYVLAGLFALEFLTLLLTLIASFITR
jgi:hypothetical protein